MEVIHISAPATVANVSCGFDAMAFALDVPGDEIKVSKNNSGHVTISRIEGAILPFDVDKNAAGTVAVEMLKDSGAEFGVDIQIVKKQKPGSGLGSSAASSAGIAVALNHFLGDKYSKIDLVRFAMLGEETACGAQIADNVSAAIFGGFVLVRSYSPLDIIPLPVPGLLYACLLHPQIEVRTEDARNVLPESVPLKSAITQWANVGGLVSGLHTDDYELIGRSVKDVIAEPARKQFIPFFDQLQEETLKNGALAFGISGSGPTVFSLSKGEENAKKVAASMYNVYEESNIDFNISVSKINQSGATIITQL
jgi:homoserine kinase